MSTTGILSHQYETTRELCSHLHDTRCFCLIHIRSVPWPCRFTLEFLNTYHLPYHLPSVNQTMQYLLLTLVSKQNIPSSVHINMSKAVSGGDFGARGNKNLRELIQSEKKKTVNQQPRQFTGKYVWETTITGTVPTGTRHHGNSVILYHLRSSPR